MAGEMNRQNVRLPDNWAADWQLDRRLGAGSYSSVYRAVRKDHPGIDAAIKIISIPNDSAEVATLMTEGMNASQSQSYYDDLARQYVTEIELLESFRGTQHIVSIEDYKVQRKINEIGNNIFIRMELLIPLDSVLRQRVLTEREVLQVGLDLCSALEMCEAKRVIHRDIKPANIFINNKTPGHVFFKLGDFGIARSMQSMAVGMSTKGTPGYMAPEVFFGRPYDNRVDIYSLGVTLYRLLNNNRLPFVPENDFSASARENALTRRFSGEKLPPPCRGSEGFKQIILKACAFDPNRRFFSASQMRQALESLLRGGNVIITDPYAGDVATTPETSLQPVRTVPAAPLASPPTAMQTAVRTEPRTAARPPRKDTPAATPAPTPKAKKKNTGFWAALAAALVIIGVVLAVVILPNSTKGPGSVATGSLSGSVDRSVPTETPTAEPTDTPEPTRHVLAAMPVPVITSAPTATPAQIVVQEESAYEEEAPAPEPVTPEPAPAVTAVPENPPTSAVTQAATPIMLLTPMPVSGSSGSQGGVLPGAGETSGSVTETTPPNAMTPAWFRSNPETGAGAPYVSILLSQEDMIPRETEDFFGWVIRPVFTEKHGHDFLIVRYIVRWFNESGQAIPDWIYSTGAEIRTALEMNTSVLPGNGSASHQFGIEYDLTGSNRLTGIGIALIGQDEAGNLYEFRGYGELQDE